MDGRHFGWCQHVSNCITYMFVCKYINKTLQLQCLRMANLVKNASFWLFLKGVGWGYVNSCCASKCTCFSPISLNTCSSIIVDILNIAFSEKYVLSFCENYVPSRCRPPSPRKTDCRCTPPP